MTTRGPWQMPGMPTPDAPPPTYSSWQDYIARTSTGQRLSRCTQIAKRTNRKRLLSPLPRIRLTGADVLSVPMGARGRREYCGSLAVEGRPSDPETSAPVAWAQAGRRVGSLSHLQRRVDGGDNDIANLVWSCLWCNTWPQARRRGAADHGGYYPS